MAVGESCPVCLVAKVMRHCKCKGCPFSQCKRCLNVYARPKTPPHERTVP